MDGDSPIAVQISRHLRTVYRQRWATAEIALSGGMHPASAFRDLDEARLAALVAERGLALVVGVADGRPLAAHAPVLLDGRRARFHLSRANPLSAALVESRRALAVVTGPDAYVSPDWYETPDQVPTWNYLSVEMEGPVVLLDEAGAAKQLDDLSAHFEARLAPKPPWTRGKMEPARFEALLGGIRAFEMTVERLEGTTKLSQNKPPEVVGRIAQALASLDDPGSQAIARLMGG
jgi:transcriptional regulator